MQILLKIKILVWYITKPLYYKQFFFLIKKKFFNLFFKKITSKSKDDLLYKTTTTEINLINDIFKSNNKSLINLRDQYSEIYKFAEKQSSLCPISMGGSSNIDLLFNLVVNHKPKIIVETGVAYGWSSLAFLLGLKSNNYGKLFSIDMPYPTLNNEKYVGCVIPENLKKNWELFRLPDLNGIPLVINKVTKVDICHYDSDKSYLGRKWAYPILWNSLNKNGIFISDDISDNNAFLEFVVQINKKPSIIKYKNQYLGLIIK